MTIADDLATIPEGPLKTLLIQRIERARRVVEAEMGAEFAKVFATGSAENEPPGGLADLIRRK